MERYNATATAFDIQVADVDYHFQTARQLRSAKAHKLFGNLIRRLFSPFGDFKSRYFLALSRTA
ncbi:hypothetical protein [Kiloniella sp.]|uniref:hypothetical protein n=1 Tax=Kiloniella sp. TaxID=1938587 RepID=UPI003B01B1DC